MRKRTIRKNNVAILLGAGVSIDAGLPDSNRLTSNVYARLSSAFDKAPATVFGYVISKLAARVARSGGSPFLPVNIEDAYDTTLRLLRRDVDPLSEFVYSWDPILEVVRRPLDTWEFANKFRDAFKITNRRSFSGQPTIEVDQFKLRSAAEAISNAFTSSAISDEAYRRVVPAIIEALITELSTPPVRTDYLSILLDFAKERADAIATLNYDTYIEDCASQSSIELDYGLSEWNLRRQVSWPDNKLKILKLHGSINWVTRYDDIHVGALEGGLFDQRLLVFGGQSEKLRPDGPYLQLRSEFERTLMSSNYMLVIGYSFADLHLNALIRSWVATRSNAKLTVLDPGDVTFSQEKVGIPFQHEGGKITRRTVEFKHVKARAAEGIKEALDECIKRPQLKAHESASTYS